MTKRISLRTTAELRKSARIARANGVRLVYVDVDVLDSLIDAAVTEPWGFWELARAKVRRRRQRKALDAMMQMDYPYEEDGV